MKEHNFSPRTILKSLRWVDDIGQSLITGEKTDGTGEADGYRC